MDQRPPEPDEPSEPESSDAAGASEPTQASQPREPTAGTPLAPPQSSIITADPVLSEDGVARPEVAWEAPTPASRREVPGAPGFVFGSTLARFAAYWLDGFILTVVAAVLSGLAAAVFALDTRTTADAEALGSIFYIILTALTAVYFVGLWTSARRATLGMRPFALQIGTAFDGRPISVVQALARWAVLGYPLALLLLVPALASVAGLVGFVLPIVLLLSTVASPTKQGLHDRVANSVVVQPAGQGTNTAAMACLIVVIAVVLISLLSIVALIFLGGQVESILSGAGESV